MPAREYRNKPPGVVILSKEVNYNTKGLNLVPLPGIFSKLDPLGGPTKLISLPKHECLVFVGHGSIGRDSWFAETKSFRKILQHYLTFFVPRLGHLVYVMVMDIMKLPVHEKPRRLLIAYTKKKKISEVCWLPQEEQQ